MKFKRCTAMEKLAVYKCIKIFPDQYKRFRELTKVDNKYTPVNIKKFTYNPWKSTDAKKVWKYKNIIIELTMEDPYIIIKKRGSNE